MWCCVAVFIALGLSTIEVRVIRPPRELRDAPSSNYLGIRVKPTSPLKLVYAICCFQSLQTISMELDDAHALQDRPAVVIAVTSHSWQAFEETLLDVHKIHEEIV